MSKKCCWCCWKLQELLSEHVLATSPRFLLPGTRATIFPWVPPKHVPVEVTKRIRASLERILHKEYHPTTTTQTSPAVSASDDSRASDIDDAIAHWGRVVRRDQAPSDRGEKDLEIEELADVDVRIHARFRTPRSESK